MQIPFWKYQGTGNDFIILNQIEKQFIHEGHREQIQSLCDRHFGIGADGLILLEKSEVADFKMVYFNSDGHLSSMCGNGGRCIVKLARELDLITDKCQFEAIDGLHNAFIDEQEWVHLQMRDVDSYTMDGDAFIIDTGSPHFVSYGHDIKEMDLISEARKVRYSDKYKQAGINVNFVNILGEQLLLRTYERGVEDETLSCGTGVTAAALTASLLTEETVKNWRWQVESCGGSLEVAYSINELGHFTNIWLIGPAALVFEGNTELFF